MAYGRSGFDQTYGKGEQFVREKVASTLEPVTRFHVPGRTLAFGSLNHPLDVKLEATYGYNPLELSRYNRFMAAALSNPNLLKDLNVSRRADLERGGIAGFEGALPRVNFPARLRFVSGAEESAGLLRTLDPTAEAVVEGLAEGLSPGGGATAEISGHDEGSYTIRYRSASASLLRVAAAYYPGWRARLGSGDFCPVVPVDHALMGVIVPAGEHELRLAYEPSRFSAGWIVSLVSLIAALAGAIYLWRAAAKPAGGPHQQDVDSGVVAT